MGPPGEDGDVEIGVQRHPPIDVVVGTRATQSGSLVAGRSSSRESARWPPGATAVNVRSIRVLERAGFVRSSESHGQIHWRLEPSRFSKRRP